MDAKSGSEYPYFCRALSARVKLSFDFLLTGGGGDGSLLSCFKGDDTSSMVDSGGSGFLFSLVARWALAGGTIC